MNNRNQNLEKIHNRGIFAFVHIEKAAGTTFIHLLRRNFFLKYIDVRPLSDKSNRVFSYQDFKKYLVINPFLKFIGGHSVVPYSDITEPSNNIEIKFVTIFRDPIHRFVSHYQHWIEKRKKKISFNEFLSIDWVKNFQVKKIAGIENVNMAKKILKERFILIGIAEEFDEFLIQLKNRLQPLSFSPYYEVQNIAIRNNIKDDIISKYYDQIYEKNILDMELYSYVKNEIIPIMNKRYGDNLRNDVYQFRKKNLKFNIPMTKLYIDYACRKAYYEPLSNGIRYLNSMPMKDSY